MPADVTIPARSPESREMQVQIQRGIRLTQRLNAIPFDEADAIRAAWSELTGQPLDPTFTLVPPVHVQHGRNTRVGRNVFINQGCTLMDIGGIDIGDDVLVGPNVSLITAGHPLTPSLRRTGITAAPICVGRNVWIGAGAVVLQGVTIGEDAVVGAGAVVTRDVPPATLVAGAPARVVRRLDDL